jgi:hypothetical protein
VGPPGRKLTLRILMIYVYKAYPLTSGWIVIGKMKSEIAYTCGKVEIIEDGARRSYPFPR